MIQTAPKPGIRYYLEIIGGIVLIIFGILFLLYLPVTFSELATIVIFIGAGILMIRKAIVDQRQAKIQAELNRNKQKNSKSKSGSKKSR